MMGSNLLRGSRQLDMDACPPGSLPAGIKLPGGLRSNEPEKWDAYIYGDVNIDLVVPGVEHFPAPGQEDEVDTMETFVGGGAALFTLGLGKLGLHPYFRARWEMTATAI